jgi:PAS domain S-box-containing protein
MQSAEQNNFNQSYRYEALFNHASMGIVVINSDGIIQSVNPFALKLFEYTAGELAEKPIELLIPGRYHHKHTGHREAYTHNPKSRPMGVGMDLFAVKKDGTEFPVEVSLGNFQNNGDKYVIAFISDISVRKEAEKEIVKLNNELEATVEQRTRELTETMHQLELSKEELTRSLQKEKELSELKSRFVSMASHEFRTPLSTVLSSAYLVEKYTSAGDQPKREKHLNRIISSVNMLTDILNDFLSVGKIEEGKIQLRFTEFDLPKTVDAVVHEMRHNAKKEQQIRYTHEGPALIVLDDSVLKHIIMNLVSNAIKFSPEQAVIEVNTLIKNHSIEIRVTDNGIGISREDQAHLMERFFRGANATNIQGTGLGLHIVAKYAELLNGVVTCSSELERGTTFIVTLKQKIN